MSKDTEVYVKTVLFPSCLNTRVPRGPNGARAVPGGKDSGWPQFLCAICESRSARSGHSDLPGVVPHAAAQSPGASVRHAHRPSAGRAAHGRGAHSALPQVWHRNPACAAVSHTRLFQTLSLCFPVIPTWPIIHVRA